MKVREPIDNSAYSKNVIRRLLVLALALLVALGAGEAFAKRRRKKPHKRRNMPMGWVWPPNKAMKAEGKQCLARLDELGVVYQKSKKKRKITTPIVVPDMEFGGVKVVPVFRKPPHVMDCHLAAALAEHGEKLYALGVRELRFSSIYDYRRVRLRQRTKNALSRHALGLAMDVYVMVTEDGVEHVVKSDYKQGDETLLAAEQLVNGTGAFRMLLTPGNDPRSHYDHFHFEARTMSERVETPSAVDLEAGPEPGPAGSSSLSR
jgi:hypothetical protein